MKHKNVLAIAVLVAGVTGFGAYTVASEHGERHGGRGHHGEKMFDEIDQDKDGIISKQEATAFHEARFQRMDADGDGKVTREEAKAHHQQMREKMHERHEKMEDCYKEHKQKRKSHSGDDD